tara:strand:- start:314 stop:550 length:237 start_codon:yes stop_codon:yes gene_type:complete
MKLNDTQLDVVRNELTNGIIDKMTEQQRRSYLHQVIYNKYATMDTDDLRKEVIKDLGHDVMQAMDTAFRFKEWLHQPS